MLTTTNMHPDMFNTTNIPYQNTCRCPAAYESLRVRSRIIGGRNREVVQFCPSGRKAVDAEMVKKDRENKFLKDFVGKGFFRRQREANS